MVREVTKLRSELFKNKDIIAILTRQVDSFRKLKIHTNAQMELLTNTINNISSDNDCYNNMNKSIQELNVVKLQNI